MSKIFLSYNREDGPFVDRLMSDLRDRGHETWVDREDIDAGSGWRTSITRAIRSCRAFLLVLSPHSVTSTNVIKELSIADSHQRYIIPLLIDDAEIPPDMEYQLADLQIIDFQAVDYETGLERILSAVARSEEKAIAVQPTPPAKADRVRTATEASPSSRTQARTILVTEPAAASGSRHAAGARTNRMAVVSLVSALLGFSFLPGIAIPIALITGYVAKRQIHNSNGTEKGLALARAGIVLGWIGLIVGVIVLCYLSAALTDEFYAY